MQKPRIIAVLYIVSFCQTLASLKMKPQKGLYMESTGIAFKVANFMFGRIKRWFAREELAQDKSLRVDVASIKKINHGDQLRITLDITNLGHMALNIFSVTPSTILINGEAYLGDLYPVDCDLASLQRKQVYISFNVPQREKSNDKLNVNIEKLEVGASKAGEKMTLQKVDLIHYDQSQAIAI